MSAITALVIIVVVFLVVFGYLVKACGSTDQGHTFNNGSSGNGESNETWRNRRK